MDSKLFGSSTLVCSSLADAIPQVLKLVKDQGRVAYVRGEPNLEVLCVDIVITDPSNRLPLVARRRPITAFCLTEFLWYCAQRNNLSSLEPYAPRISHYYGGIRSTTGSDYGRQLFGDKIGGSQWDKIVTLLKRDPGSKRAFIGIYNADEVNSLLPENCDLSCTIGFQILIRDGHLNWITSMRANDAYRGFVSDTFSFTLFQELMAATLGVRLGQYVHRPTSLHTFPEDEEVIDRIIEARLLGESSGEIWPPMPPIEPKQYWRYLPDFWSIHDRARISGNWQLLLAVDDFGGDWWTWVAKVFSDYHGVR